MKEKTFTKTLLTLLAFMSLTLLSSCDKLDEDDYMEKLVGSWVSTLEYQNGVEMSTDELVTMNFYVYPDYTFYLSLSEPGDPTTDWMSTGSDAKFEMYRNKIIMSGSYGVRDLSFVWEIESISDTEMWIYGDDSSFYNAIRTKFEKQFYTDDE